MDVIRAFGASRFVLISVTGLPEPSGFNRQHQTKTTSAFFMENQQEIHIGSIIKTELDRQGRKPQWFAAQLNFERTNIYNIFRRKSIDTALLLRISQILQFDFFSFYSKQVPYVENYSTNN